MMCFMQAVLIPFEILKIFDYFFIQMFIIEIEIYVLFLKIFVFSVLLSLNFKEMKHKLINYIHLYVSLFIYIS